MDLSVIWLGLTMSGWWLWERTLNLVWNGLNQGNNDWAYAFLSRTKVWTGFFGPEIEFLKPTWRENKDRNENENKEG